MSMAPNDAELVLPFDPRVGIGADHLLGALTLDVRTLLSLSYKNNINQQSHRLVISQRPRAQTSSLTQSSLKQPLSDSSTA